MVARIGLGGGMDTVKQKEFLVERYGNFDIGLDHTSGSHAVISSMPPRRAVDLLLLFLQYY